MKKQLALILALLLCMALAAPALAEDAPHVEVSRQTLKVDGTVYKCEKYNIDGENYFKLRDIAYLLWFTGSQFNVGWDSETSTVSITRGAEYEWAGRNLLLGADRSSTAQRTAQTILIDGEEVTDMKVYNIGGSNFFRLRDLGGALGFDVDYDAASDTAVVKSHIAQFLPSRTEEAGSYKHYEYDLDGNETVTDIKYHSIHTYTYTPEGREATEQWRQEEDGGQVSEGSRSYTYDADGNVLTTARTEDGETETFTRTYDENGNMLTEQYSHSDERYMDSLTTYTYNSKGYPVKKTVAFDGEPTVTEYTYDERNNLISEKSSDPDFGVTEIVYTYDGAGNCLSRKEILDGEVFQEDLKTYNEAGLLLSETSTQTLSSDYVVTFVAIYTYDGAGRQLKVENSWTELIDGKTTSSSNSTTTSYDVGGRVLVDETKTSEGNYDRSVYTYDSEGRMLTSSYTDSSGESYSDTYSYDDAGRHVRTETVSPDGATYTTYNYDANGNLVRSDSSDGGYFIGEYIAFGAK